MNKMTPICSLRHVSYAYQQGDQSIEVLKDINLFIHQGELVALTGPSGSGKTTSLNIAGLLTRPQSGTVKLQETNCGDLSDREKTLLRRQSIGIVHQFHHLLPEFTAEENLMLPLMIQGISRHKARQKAQEMLEKVGLDHRLTHRPAQLSGGEQQRVAVARALVRSPLLLLADEPTGNLDEKTANDVFGLFLNLARQESCAVLMVTHNPDLAKQMNRILTFKNNTLETKTL